MKKKISVWKVASIATMVAISGAMFACEEELESEITEIIEESTQQIEHSDDVQAVLNRLATEKPGEKFVVIETLIENEESIRKLNAYDPGQIEHIIVNKEGDEKSVTMIVNQSSDLFDKTIEIQEQVNPDDKFVVVEKPASFKGGVQGLYEYIGTNMQYPNQARELGVEGTVFVEFTVETDGSISEATVIKGIGAGCDAEALRVIQDSPNWIPGTQGGQKVRQKMVQKVNFKLPETD